MRRATKEDDKKYREENKGSFLFFTAKMYGRQRESSRSRGHKMPTYTLEELRYWMQQQENLSSLMKAYKESGFKKDFIPSVDRLDNSKSYSFDNIQLVSWRENYMKERAKMSKAVNQLTMEGEFVKEWSSMEEVERYLGIFRSGISNVCRGKQKTAGGFKWEYSKK